MRAWAHLGAVIAVVWGASVQGDPVPLQAMSQAELRAVLIETGQNLRDSERHAVEVEGCQMTTYWWKMQPDGSDVLWSSFQFNMALADLRENKAQPGTYAFLALENARGLEDLAMFFFAMRDGVTARYEKPFVRSAPRGDRTPSPRGDGSTHYYDTSVSFFVRHEGVGIADRAGRFAAAYVLYADSFCRLSG